MPSQFRKIQGPYSVLALSGPVPVAVLQLPFAEVRGGQLTITAQDNLSRNSIGSYDGAFGQCAIIEVEIVGLTMGVPVSLRRQQLRQDTGPLTFQFDDTDAFENFEVRTRCMRGGLRQPQNDPSISEFAPANGYQAQITVVIQKRGWIPVRETKPEPSNV